MHSIKIAVVEPHQRNVTLSCKFIHCNRSIGCAVWCYEIGYDLSIQAYRVYMQMVYMQMCGASLGDHDQYAIACMKILLGMNLLLLCQLAKSQLSKTLKHKLERWQDSFRTLLR